MVVNTVTDPALKLPKDVAISVVEAMPADSGWDDIIRELLMHRMIERGLADVEAGRTITHEQAQSEVTHWLKSAGQHVPPAA